MTPRPRVAPLAPLAWLASLVALAALPALGLSGIGCVRAKPAAPDSAPRAAGADETPTLAGYAASCVERLGPFPAKLDCFDADASRALDTWTMAEGGRLARLGHDVAYAENARCDNPSWGVHPSVACAPGTRLARYDVTSAPAGAPDAARRPATTWSLLCRKNAAGLPEKTFDVLGLIGHEVTTGDTCFFESKRDVDATRVPAPDVPGATAFWTDFPALAGTRESQCVSCHGAAPFLRNAFVAGVSPRDPERARKLAANARHVPDVDPNGPYRVVWADAFARYHAYAWKPRMLDREAADRKAKACTTCHRLPAAPKALELARLFVFPFDRKGRRPYPALDPAVAAHPLGNSHGLVVAGGASAALPAHPRDLDEAAWKDAFAPAVSDVHLCSDEPYECVSKDIPTER